MDRPYRDPDWLEQQYHGEGLRQREIGELCDVSPSTIRKQMKAFGIETREVKGENHGMYGKERSEEVKEKISEKLKGREFSEESIRKMSEAHKGKTIPKDVREKISESLKGVPKSNETRRRMRRAKSGAVTSNPPHWMHVAYNRGFKPVKREVHNRDEVCQICHHDGSHRSLEVHHIIPIRLFREIDELDFKDAHCLGNLILLCQSCHRVVERGQIEIKPDFCDIPPELHEAFRTLWKAYADWTSTSDISDSLGE